MEEFGGSMAYQSRRTSQGRSSAGILDAGVDVAPRGNVIRAARHREASEPPSPLDDLMSLLGGQAPAQAPTQPAGDPGPSDGPPPTSIGDGFPFQSQLERVFGQDLSGLDVHVGGAANTTLEGLNAKGASIGDQIFLPSNPSFDVVTHEVAHGLQVQKFGAPDTGVSEGGERAEQEADRAVDLAARGQHVELSAAPSAAVHRWGLGDLWDGAVGAAKGVANTVADVGGAVWDGGVNVLDTATSLASIPGEMITTTVANTWNTGADLVDVATDPNRSLEEKLTDGAGAVLSGGWDQLGDQLGNLAMLGVGVPELLRDVSLAGADISTCLAGGLADDVLPFVADAVQGGGGLIGDAVQAGGGLLGDLVNDGGDLLGDLVSGGGDLLGDLVGQGADLLGDLAGDGGNWLGERVTTGGDLLGDGLDLASELLSDGIGVGVGLGQDMLSGLGGLDTGIPLIDGLVDAGTGGLSDLIGAGGDLAQSLVGGGGDVLSWGVDALSGWTGAGLAGFGELIESGVSDLGELSAEGIRDLSELIGDGISGLSGIAGDGVRDLSDLIGGGLRDGSAVLSEGIGWFAEGLSQVSGSVRDFFGLDEVRNDFTGFIEMQPSAEGFVQQYSELGIPLTDEAWGFQDAVDGGKLHTLYENSLLSTMQDPDFLKELVERRVLKPNQIPKNFSELTSEELRSFTDLARREIGSAEAFLALLDRDDRKEFQETMLHEYMDMARDDENAAFVFEMLPTEMGQPDFGEAIADGVIRGQAPNNFAVGDSVGKARLSDVKLAQHYQQQGMNTYGLVVPYSNRPSNVVGRTGTPTDGSDHLQNYLEMLKNPVTGERDITTVATGYSQGGAAVLDYVERYGNTGLLDNAVAMAPMGGTDRHGGTGVHSGEWNSVQTLSIMNDKDPAQHLHGDNLLSLAPGMLNFGTEVDVPWLEHERDRHGQYWGNIPDYELKGATEEELTEAYSAGTIGYPTGYIQPMIADLLNGGFKGYGYERRGGWDYDLNELLGVGAGGEPTGYDLPDDPREIADQYLPE